MTKATFGTMRRHGIPLLALPQTLQDAVFVTRSLGFKYLWIDALCVVQDSKRTKLEDITNMDKIYHHAALTIFAMGASSVQDGFISTLESESCTFQLPLQLPGRPPIQITLKRKTIEVASSQTWPLDDRAWALQEFLLSRRRLIFTKTNILWQCQSVDTRALRCDHIIHEGLHRLPSLPREGFNLANGCLGTEGQTQIWERIAVDFSRRKITHPKDRLDALYGIVAVLRRVWGDEYFCGLWKRDLVWQLGWHVCTTNGDTIPPGIPTRDHAIRHNSQVRTVGQHQILAKRQFSKVESPELVAPSWSWVSANRLIAFRDSFEDRQPSSDSRNCVIEAKFIDCVRPPCDNAWDLTPSSSTTLVIKSQLLPLADLEIWEDVLTTYCELRFDSEADSEAEWLSHDAGNCFLLLLSHHKRSDTVAESMYTLHDFIEHGAWPHNCDRAARLRCPGKQRFCSRTLSRGWTSYGLILDRVDRLLFRRIGRFAMPEEFSRVYLTWSRTELSIV